MAAKPVIYYHQTLTFSKPIYDSKSAKRIFNRFMKAVIKHYGNLGLSALHVQERRKDGTLHYHVCFLIFTPDRFSFAPSHFYRDFRTDLYKRWNKLNGGKCAHVANKLIPHEYNLESIYYFCKALEIPDVPPKRAETNWWGLWNEELVNKNPYNPSKNEVRNWFNEIFKKSNTHRSNQIDFEIIPEIIPSEYTNDYIDKKLNRFYFSSEYQSQFQPQNYRELSEIPF